MKKLFCALLFSAFSPSYAFDTNDEFNNPYTDLSIDERKKIIYQDYADLYPFDFFTERYTIHGMQITDVELLRAKNILAYHSLGNYCTVNIEDVLIGKEDNDYDTREYIFTWVGSFCGGGSGIHFRQISSVTIFLDSQFVNGVSDFYMPADHNSAITESVYDDYFNIEKLNNAYYHSTGNYDNLIPRSSKIMSQKNPDHYLLVGWENDIDDHPKLPSIRVIYEFKRSESDYLSNKWKFKELSREKIAQENIKY